MTTFHPYIIRSVCRLLCTTIISLSVSAAQAQYRSIYEIQYTTAADGGSPYHGQLLNCRGGVVVGKMVRSRPRLVLYDPAYPDGWGGIQVKDFNYVTNYFEGIEVGDWVELQNMKVEEFRGTTFLELYQANQFTLTVVSRGHPVPAALVLDPNEIAAPLPDAHGDYYVADHAAERYESMLVRVETVQVTRMGLGKAQDNYELSRLDNQTRCWATDYNNDSCDPFLDYCDAVQMDQKFCFVEGVLEQYTKISTGFDYYQIMTLSADQLQIPSAADVNDDCAVNMLDYAIFSGFWLEPGCGSSPVCVRLDCNQDTILDLVDLACFADDWLTGVSD